MGDASATISATRAYGLLGHPSDLRAHVDVLGPLPVPAKDERVWRESFVSELEASGLTGRGGAGFPAATKVAAHLGAGRGGTVVVNAMEGEPASDKDTLLLLTAPHLVLDGAQLLAAAGRASQVIVSVPEGRPHVVHAVTAALGERASSGYARVPERLATPPERFVGGEESALVGWIESGVGLPAFRPDKATPLRIGRRAALVHNAETLAHVAMIARRGSAAFRAHGRPDDPGTSLVTISGAVARPGVVEVDRGTPLLDIATRATLAGTPQALLVGGYGGAWVPPADFDTPYASLPLRAVGATAGVGVIVVLGADGCGVTETARLAHYLASEGAGQCGPCVYGLPAIADDLGHLATGQAPPGLLGRLEHRLDEVDGRGACRHPDGVVRLVRSALRVFAADVHAHAGGFPCPQRMRASVLRLPGPRVVQS